MTCPKCSRETALPYMCRDCWHLLGTAGQLAVYRTQGRQTKSPPYSGPRFVLSPPNPRET